MSDNVEFVSGLYVKPPHEKAPDFVKFSISIKRADLGNWLRGKDDEWINLQVKESREGKWYACVDNWKPEKKADFQAPPARQSISTEAVDDKGQFDYDDDIPF